MNRAHLVPPALARRAGVASDAFGVAVAVLGASVMLAIFARAVPGAVRATVMAALAPARASALTPPGDASVGRPMNGALAA